MVPKCAQDQSQTPRQRAKDSLNGVHRLLQNLKADVNLVTSSDPPQVCLPFPPKKEPCPTPCNPFIKCRPSGPCDKGKPCSARGPKKCDSLKPSWLCGTDLDKYILNPAYDGPFTKETEILKINDQKSKNKKDDGCPPDDCDGKDPCIQCLVDTINNLMGQLDSDDDACADESDDDNCPQDKPTCKKCDDGCCPQPPVCPCCEDVIDKCLLQMCPADPLSPANRCFLKTRAQCIINYAKQKYIAAFCTRPEEFLPSLTGEGWKESRLCFPPKKRADFQFDTYDPYILHAKKSRCKKAAYCVKKIQKTKKK